MLLNETSRLWNSINLLTPSIKKTVSHLTACIYGQKSVWKDVPQSVHSGSLETAVLSSRDPPYFLLSTSL